jgi:hypothetical protein
MIPVLAAELGYTHYWQLDDDYLGFWHRAQMFVADDNDRPFLSARSVHDLDAVVDATLDFLDTSGATAIAFAQAGDFIGGLASGFWRDGLRRKAMNTFLARVDDPVRFVGRLNDDVNTVVTESMRGRIYFTLTDVMIVPVLTQQEPGGMTDAYAEAGTWVKSFMSVMYAPSAVRVAEMGRAIMRIHHQVTWNRVAPKILSDQHRKARA